ncbi:hypothetical protein FDECE_1361 [Fusarium decemcellulare]|nr:hypothetical protein FDECE_1361 [Fusarium decemcellulare]
MAEVSGPLPQAATAGLDKPTPVASTRGQGIYCLDIAPQDLGIKVLHDPQDVDEVTIDVVAVHGIGVNPNSTWSHRKTKTNWLSDENMLPQVLPKARIMAFGYDSVWYGEGGGKRTLEGVATKLLNELMWKRENCPNRPILFIGHCFGGLVIQQAYTQGLLHKHDWPHLSESVIGLVFLGTPHHGLNESVGLSTQGQIYKAIIAAGLRPQENALQSMAHDNDVLRGAVDSFTRIINTTKPQPTIFCFYEERETEIGQIVGMKIDQKFVVNQTSGTLNGHQKEGLSLDHFNMNKFQDPQDNHFVCVSRQIAKIANNIPDTEATPEKSPKLDRRNVIPILGAPIAAETNFAPRGDIIDKIASRMKKRGLVALYGASGQGKTHVAVQYAEEYVDSNAGNTVYWVNANSPEEFEASFVRLAEHLHLALEGEGHCSVVKKVGRILRKKSFLMVLDGFDTEDSLPGVNFDSDKPLSDLIPHSDKASFLITTRSKSVATQFVKGKPKYMIEVGRLDLDDASQLLFGRVLKDKSKRKTIEKVSEILDGSAGGLAMVASYLGNTGRDINIKTCLADLEKRSSDQKGSVRIWELLYNLIKHTAPESEDIMLVMSCLNVQCVPAELFDRDQSQEYMPVLEKHDIVEPSTDRWLFTVNPMVRDCAQQWLSKHPSAREHIEGVAVGAILKKFNEENGDILLPCALAALKFEHLSQRSKREQTALLFTVAKKDMDQMNHKRALEFLRSCLERREADSNLPDRDRLIQETKQAIYAVETGLTRPNEAIARAKSGAIIEVTEVEGSNPVRTMAKVDQDDDFYNCMQAAQMHYNKALEQVAKGKYSKAEKLYISAMEVLQDRMSRSGQNKILMSLHLKVLSCLGYVYFAQGRLEDASEIYRTVLPEQEELLGVNHPDTLLTRNDYALVLQESDLNAAGKELKRVHEEQVKLLGPDDEASLRTETNLALNYRLQGNDEEAKKRYQDVLKRQDRKFGKTHRDTRATQVMLDELLGTVDVKEPVRIGA